MSVQSSKEVYVGAVSTLLSRNVVVTVSTKEDRYLVAMYLLREHGKWIRKLRLRFCPDRVNIPHPRVWIEKLIECLKHVPSLQAFQLGVQVWNGNEASREQWERFVPPPAVFSLVLHLLRSWNWTK